MSTTTINQQEQVGVLYVISPKNLQIDKAIGNAIRLFNLSIHCTGRRAAEAHINPKDINGLGTTKHGLQIIADATVRRGYIRVCTEIKKEVIEDVAA